MTVVWVCGSRDLVPPLEVLCDVLRRLGVSRVIHGGARGVDTAAGYASRVLGLPEPAVFEADWDRLGKAAGAVRNGDCAALAKQLAGCCLAVYRPPYATRGTADAIVRALAAEIPVHALEGEPDRSWKFIPRAYGRQV